MKSITINSNQLGVKCWSPLRFLDLCHHCLRYKHCKYPERIVNEKYDEIVREISEISRHLEELKDELKNV